MATRKRNEWLDAADSGSDDPGYDSEAAEESRRALVSKAGRSNKRRKTSPTADDDSDAASMEEGDGLAEGGNHSGDDGVRAAADGAGLGADLQDQDVDDELDGHEPSKLKLPKLLSSKSVEKSQRAAKKSGVIYISRVPPFMKPQTVKQLLGRFGPIGRIFLTPESGEKHSARVKSGGNKKKSYTDGWIEFLSKKDAKLCAETLNTQIIGGRKGGWYHDDVWNLKYLKGFKWHHLTEQIANENAERVSRMRAEIAQTTRENKAFLANVEKAKMLENMKTKKRRREGDGAGALAHQEAVDSDTNRHFRQTEVKRKGVNPADQADQPDEVKRVLSKIF